METWGYCGGCSRWFYCDQSERHRDAEPTCPVCSGPATRLEQRSTGEAAL